MLDISVLGDFEQRYLALDDIKEIDALAVLDSACRQYLQDNPILIENYSQAQLEELHRALQKLSNAQAQVLSICQAQAKLLETEITKVNRGHRSAASYLGIANQ